MAKIKTMFWAKDSAKTKITLELWDGSDVTLKVGQRWPVLLKSSIKRICWFSPEYYTNTLTVDLDDGVTFVLRTEARPKQPRPPCFSCQFVWPGCHLASYLEKNS